MNKILWQPTTSRINNSNLLRFSQKLQHELGLNFENYQQLHQWSVDEPEIFWQKVWEFTDIKASQAPVETVTGGDNFSTALWFQGARLNFAENLLRNHSDKPALVCRLENGARHEVSYTELYQQVARLAAALRAMGLKKGDRVAGFLPNIIETVIAMLASASLGAIWSSCSPDFGFDGAFDRLNQIQPRILFAADGYFYKGKTIDSIPRVQKLSQKITSLEKVVIVTVIQAPNVLTEIDQAVFWQQFLISDETPELIFEQLPFDHPLYIAYSSGTTGKPKCIIHSAGGTLIQHVKEQQLHTDLKPDDRLFYFTTCGWMMWNWLVSGLASEATVILYDGSPFYPEPTSLIDLLEQEKVSIFGASAKYLEALQKAQASPKNSHEMGHLKTILSTGSPLSPESFRYVYREIKEDLCLSSISGGTDILSCFVLGNPCLPVIEGEIQCIGLGMAVEIWDEKGNSVQQQKGELVCTRPFPSAPVGFWNDTDNKRYFASYFSTHPGIWVHGDYGEISSQGGIIIHGRSDTVLNPGGVRIGTAEIYRQVDKIHEITNSACVGQQIGHDVRIVLFIVLRDGIVLSEELKGTIRKAIRAKTTPRHVPAKIIAVDDIPRTISGKNAELAIRDTIHGANVSNIASLANPEALNLFKDLPELQL